VLCGRHADPARKAAWGWPAEIVLREVAYGCVHFAVQRTVAAADVLPAVVGAETPIEMTSVSAVNETLCVGSTQDVLGVDVSSISHVTVVSDPFLRLWSRHESC
jgi:hypothetical protein